MGRYDERPAPEDVLDTEKLGYYNRSHLHRVLNEPGTAFSTPIYTRGQWTSGYQAEPRPGCCDVCQGRGATLSGPCSDCYGTGHAHPKDQPCDPEEKR